MFAQNPIDPIPKRNGVLTEKERLGKTLFFDPNLSKDKKISCASCHKKKYGGSNGKQKGIGVFGRVTKYNVPSIYNLRYQYVYGWKRKSYSLKKKIEEIMKDPNIMDTDFKGVIFYLENSHFFKKKF